MTDTLPLGTRVRVHPNMSDDNKAGQVGTVDESEYGPGNFDVVVYLDSAPSNPVRFYTWELTTLSTPDETEA